MNLQDKTVVVTGAGSGIGRALCGALAGRGASVAACDIDVATAEATVAGLPPARSPHRAFPVDVSDEASFESLAKEVVTAFGSVDGLVNNAGVLGQMAPLCDLTTEELRWMIGIDLWGVIYGCRAFVPLLRGRPEAALVNVSSAAGLIGGVGNPAYVASKFGVRGFTEAVRSELRKTPVKVTLVMPGLVRTNLASSHPGYTQAERAEAVRRYNAQPGISPERAAAKIIRGIGRGRPRVLVGPDVLVIDKLVRLAPADPARLMHGAMVKVMNKLRPDGKVVFD